jgi:hypothetical protein
LDTECVANQTALARSLVIVSWHELVEQEAKIAVHYLFDLRRPLLQSVVYDSTVDEVVRANLVTASPRAHLRHSGSTVIFFPLGAVVLMDFRCQNPKCLATVLVLITAIDENLKTGGVVSGTDGGVGLVLMLAAGTSPALCLDEQLARRERFYLQVSTHW